jgi:hypothetical protein
VARPASAREPQRRHEAGAAGAEGPVEPKVGAAELDRLIHERIRLGIVSALAVN